MSLELLKGFFLWCTVINGGIFVLAFVFICFGSSWIYRTHSWFFRVDEEGFNRIVYSIMMFYKTFIFAFNLVPYIALRIIGS